MSDDAVASNYTYFGYSALFAESPFGSADLRGPSIHKTLSATGFEQGRCGVVRSTGKRYLEFNLRWESPHDNRYRAGVVSPAHPKAVKLADHAAGWGFETTSRKFVTGGALTDPPTSDYDMFIACDATNMGWWSHTSGPTQINVDGYVLRMAVDFDAGKIWFGVYRSAGPFKDFWTGDPAAGTGHTYSFAPNTDLVPAICLINDGATSQAFAGLIGTVPAYCRGQPPAGFTHWDTGVADVDAVLATAPDAIWLASPPHLTTKAAIGYPPQNLDWGPNKRLFRHDLGDSDTLTSHRRFGGRVRTVFSNPRTSRPRYFYPLTVTSTQSFVAEVAVELIDTGRWVFASSKYWTEGSGLFQNAVDPRAGGVIDPVNLWFGAAYNSTHIAFGHSGSNVAYEIFSLSPQGGRLHYLAFECDCEGLYQRIYVNGALAAEGPFSPTPGLSTDWIAVGACDPQQIEGGFPGYFCGFNFYFGTLAPAQHAAHYALFLDGLPANPIGLLEDGRTARFPYFAV